MSKAREGEDGEEQSPELDKTPVPLRRRPLLRVGGRALGGYEPSGDLEVDALRLAPDEDLEKILSDGTHPLHAKAKQVRADQRAPLREAAERALGAGRSSQLNDAFERFTRGMRGAVQEASRSVAKQVEHTRAQVSWPALPDPDPQLTEGLIDPDWLVNPTVESNKLLAESIEVAREQHEEVREALLEQNRQLGVMLDIARQDAEDARQDAADARAEAETSREETRAQTDLSRRTHKWTIFAAISAVAIGVAAILVTFFAPAPVVEVVVPEPAPPVSSPAASEPAPIRVPFPPGSNVVEWWAPADPGAGES